MTRRPMRDAHASGRFTATDRERDALFAALARHTDLAGATEDRGRDCPDGWNRRGNTESNVYWAGGWEYLDHGTATIATPEWKRGTARAVGVALEWVLLRHPDGWTLLRVVAHFPAHLFRRAQRRAHKAATSVLPDELEDLREDTGADEVTLSLDANVDLRLKRNREPLERRGYRVIASRRGTHGLRVIDGFLTTLRGDATRLHRFKGLDHRTVVANLHRTPKEHR